MHIYTIIGSEISYIGGNYKNDKPLLAANKAGKALFKKLEDVKYAKHKNRKSIKFIIKMKDRNGPGKTYSYQVIKEKLKKPILIKVKNTEYYVKFNYVIKACDLSKKQKKKLLGGQGGLFEQLGRNITANLIGEDIQKKRKEEEARKTKEENEKREREEERKREERLNNMGLFSQFVNNVKGNLYKDMDENILSEDKTAKTDNKDNDKNITQLSEDAIWTKILKILESLKINEIISENIMQLTVEEKKVNISAYGICSIEAQTANKFFNEIIYNLFLIKAACTFKCSQKIKNGLDELGAINNEDSEIVKLNKKYQIFLKLCIQYCKENHTKHFKNYKNYIANKKFSNADKELADANKHEKSNKEIETIINSSTGGKKKKGGNDDFLPELDENKYSLIEGGKNKNKKKYTGGIRKVRMKY